MENKHFLIESTIPTKHHGWLLNMFFDGIRAGLHEPEKIIYCVKSKTLKKLEDQHLASERQKILKSFLKLLDTPGTISFAQHALDQQKLTPEERHKLKEARAEVIKHNYLASEQPSSKQTSYLAVLGYDGQVPKTKLEASELIDKILKDKGEAA